MDSLELVSLFLWWTEIHLSLHSPAGVTVFYDSSAQISILESTSYPTSIEFTSEMCRKPRVFKPMTKTLESYDFQEVVNRSHFVRAEVRSEYS